MNKGRRAPPITWSHEGIVGLRSGSRLRLCSNAQTGKNWQYRRVDVCFSLCFTCFPPPSCNNHCFYDKFQTSCSSEVLFADDRDKRQKAFFCKQFWHQSCLNWRKRDQEEAGMVDESSEGGIRLARRWNKHNYFNKGRSTLLLIIFDL